MLTRIRRATMFALYQFSVATGIMLLPIAMLARQAGVTLPVHRVVETTKTAYEDVESHA